MALEPLAGLGESLSALMQALAGLVVAIVELAALVLELIVHLILTLCGNKSGRERRIERMQKRLGKVKRSRRVLLGIATAGLCWWGWFAGLHQTMPVSRDGSPAVHEAFDLESDGVRKRVYAREGAIRLPRFGDFTLRTAGKEVVASEWSAARLRELNNIALTTDRSVEAKVKTGVELFKLGKEIKEAWQRSKEEPDRRKAPEQ